jgi:hypothetical protein
MNLCLSQKIVTWKAKNSRNIIDLIFMIERLQASITHCENKRDLNQSSNHISIFTIFTLKIEQTSVKKRRAWKKINSERLTSCLRAFVVSASFNNVNDIETFVKEIQFSVQSIIQEAILMIRKSERAQFFWSFKCSEIVTTIKKRRREWSFLRIKKNWKTYLKFIDVKKKIIVKKKKLKFRNFFEKFTIQTISFWRFVRWAKTQSHKSKKILKVSILIQKNSLKETIRIVKNLKTKRTCSRSNFFQKQLKQILMTWWVLIIATSLWRRRRWFQKTKYVKLSKNANSTMFRTRTKYQIVYWKFW